MEDCDESKVLVNHLHVGVDLLFDVAQEVEHVGVEVARFAESAVGILGQDAEADVVLLEVHGIVGEDLLNPCHKVVNTEDVALVLGVALLGFRGGVECWGWEGSTTDSGVVDHVYVSEVAGIEAVDAFAETLTDVEANLRFDTLASELHTEG